MMITKITAGSYWYRIKHVRAMCGQNALWLLMSTYQISIVFMSHFQWPRGLRLGIAARSSAEILVSNPAGGWMSICCECFMLSSRDLCDELITHPEESYRLWCYVGCNLEPSRLRRPWPTLGHSTTGQNTLLWKTYHKLLVFQQFFCRFLKCLLMALFQIWLLCVNNESYTSNLNKFNKE
jgi:hypothetical protein